MLNIKISIRNLSRYKYRTWLTGIMILITTFIFIFGLSLSEGISQGLINRIITLNTGDIIITSDQNTASTDAAFDDVKWDRQRILNKEEIDKKLLKYSEVEEVQNRAKVTGILSADSKSGSCVIVGIEPGKESGLLNSDLSIYKGAFLSVDKAEGQIYISSTISRTYGLDIGDKLELVCQSTEMKSSKKEFTVCGIFNSTSWKEYYVYINIQDAQTLTGLGKDGVTHIKVLLKDRKDVKQVKKQINADLGNIYHIYANDWKSASGLLLATVMVMQSSVYGMCVILFLLIIVILINNISMSIFERTNEIGILKAMGKEDKSIINMFLIENLILSIIFSGLGELLGVISTLILHKTGIPAFVEVLRLSFGTDCTYPVLKIPYVILTFLLPVAVSLIVSILPMKKVIKLSPAVAASYEK